MTQLVVSLVFTRLDYGCTTLVGLPHHRLQSVMNAAARLVHRARKFDHITPLLRDLHWLRVPERITFRLDVLAYRCQHGLGPSYLITELHRVLDVESRQRLRSASSGALVVAQTFHPTIGDRSFFSRRCLCVELSACDDIVITYSVLLNAED
jgi:hypothetical protein